MLNGNTLKMVFLGIVATLCIILLGLTLMSVAGKLPVETYKELVGILGIPTLFGMIVQSFIHADINKNGVPDIKETTEEKK